MARSEPQLSDEHVTLVLQKLDQLYDFHESDEKVAEYLRGATGAKVSTSNLNRWRGRRGRPGIDAWRLLEKAGAIDSDASVPQKPARRGELRPEDIAELKQAAKTMMRIVSRLG